MQHARIQVKILIGSSVNPQKQVIPLSFALPCSTHFIFRRFEKPSTNFPACLPQKHISTNIDSPSLVSLEQINAWPTSLIFMAMHLCSPSFLFCGQTFSPPHHPPPPILFLSNNLWNRHLVLLPRSRVTIPSICHAFAQPSSPRPYSTFH